MDRIDLDHHVAFTFLLLVFTTGLVFYIWRVSTSCNQDIKHSPTQQTPVLTEQSIPDPTPCLDFDIKTSMTRDYIYANKPLRYPYHQTMAHQP